MPADEWAILSKNSARAWKINRAFLKQQIRAGKNFLLASPLDAGGYFFQKEIEYITSLVSYGFI